MKAGCIVATWMVLPLALGVLLAGCGAETAQEPEFRILVFSRTTEFRHPSIPDGISAIRQLGRENDFAVEATEDDSRFTDDVLERFDAVVFLNTTGDVLGAEEQAAFERYIRSGGGFAGIHAAADTEYGWGWYGGLVGAYFESHPAIQTAVVEVSAAPHPSTSGLPGRWVRRDEWYNFRTNPRDAGVRVLATLDEAGYSPGAGAMGADHPISWCHEYDGGRGWYTGLGHTPESYAEDPFLRHLLGGMRAAAGAARPWCGPS